MKTGEEKENEEKKNEKKKKKMKKGEEKYEEKKKEEKKKSKRRKYLHLTSSPISLRAFALLEKAHCSQASNSGNLR